MIHAPRDAYKAKLEAFIAELVKNGAYDNGDVIDIVVVHEDHGQFEQGGVCECDAEIELMDRPPT